MKIWKAHKKSPAPALMGESEAENTRPKAQL